jgi:hypothetical protein
LLVLRLLSRCICLWQRLRRILYWLLRQRRFFLDCRGRFDLWFLWLFHWQRLRFRYSDCYRPSPPKRLQRDGRQSRWKGDFAHEPLSKPVEPHLAVQAVSHHGLYHTEAKTPARRGIDGWASPLGPAEPELSICRTRPLDPNLRFNFRPATQDSKEADYCVITELHKGSEPSKCRAGVRR